MFLTPIAENEASGRVAEIYAAQKAQLGFVMETAKAFTPRPDLLPIYTEFNEKMRAGFSLGARGWKLITLIAAKYVPSTYCSIVYAKQLVGDLGSMEQVLKVQRDFRNAGLSKKDVAMLAYAEKIVKDATQVTADDIARLREVGFSDCEICDIALCASFRCFVSRFFDAMGTEPEEAFFDKDPAAMKQLSVGRKVRLA
jgi:uncharacterized peroxidase-related enzyme